MKFLEVDLSTDRFSKAELVLALQEAKYQLTWYVCDALRRSKRNNRAGTFIADRVSATLEARGINSYCLINWAIENNPDVEIESDGSENLLDREAVEHCPHSALAYRKAWIDHMIKELQQ